MRNLSIMMFLGFMTASAIAQNIPKPVVTEVDPKEIEEYLKTVPVWGAGYLGQKRQEDQRKRRENK